MTLRGSEAQEIRDVGRRPMVDDVIEAAHDLGAPKRPARASRPGGDDRRVTPIISPADSDRLRAILRDPSRNARDRLVAISKGRRQNQFSRRFVRG
jgi:hypothetical protein